MCCTSNFRDLQTVNQTNDIQVKYRQQLVYYLALVIISETYFSKIILTLIDSAFASRELDQFLAVI
jgi:hypothetical protein